MSSRKRFAKHVYRDILFRQNFNCACGCREIILPGDVVNYDHWTPLHLGGEDTPANLRALKGAHHLKKTVAEAKARGKVRRIVLKSGLRTKGKNAKEKRLEKIRQWERMP